jgi:hypothetical protein
MGDTYVNNGLGNFLWYHNHEPESGVLRVRIRAGEVVGDTWIPARIQTYAVRVPSPDVNAPPASPTGSDCAAVAASPSPAGQGWGPTKTRPVRRMLGERFLRGPLPLGAIRGMLKGSKGRRIVVSRKAKSDFLRLAAGEPNLSL